MVIQDQQETGDFEDMRSSCVIYDSWKEMIVSLPDEMAGELIKMILTYGIDGEHYLTENPALAAMFNMISKKLDEDKAKYDAQVERARNNSKRSHAEVGTKSGRSQNEVKGDTVTVTVTESVTDTDSVNDTESVKETKQRKFVKPSVDEVREYCQERQNNIDPDAFVDFYESKGWKVGSNPMKDWKAAVRTWEKRSDKPVRSSPKSDITAEKYAKIHNYTERKIDYEALGAQFING